MQDVARELTSLHGTAEPPRAGILHIMHVARAPDGRLSALRIGAASTPASESDFFVLNAARAHADAILTSAENLRREPGLSHALQGAWADALANYRREVLGKSEPPTVAILTRSGDLPDPHPVWHDGTPKLIFTPALPSASAPTGTSPPPRGRAREGARTIALSGLDAVRAAHWLQAHDFPLVNVEAGPRTVAALYAAQAVTELWLTRWESVTADAEFAGALPEDASLFHGLELLGSAHRSEGGHDFRFERWVRRSKQT
jgi:riboflavin biosynthesis pyrimidine reductase